MGVDKIECIECEADRQWALAEIERLAEYDPDSPEGRERDVLLTMVAKYEAKGKPAYRQPI